MVSTAVSEPMAPPVAGSRAAWPWAAIVFFAALWFVLCRHLSGEWSVNEQYNYGWFVPLFAAYLFWLRWAGRPGKVESRRAAERGARSDSEFRRPVLLLSTSAFLLVLLLLLPLRLFEVANPDWRPLGWIHAFAVVGLSCIALWSIGGTPWLRHFLFPVAFILVAVPWLSAIETPIVQGLMGTVASAASETLTLFGIPAQVEGNLIRVSTGLVGVNEACSGVRSLQTSLMIGLLFGELKRLSVGRRIVLVVGALATALIANFLRALMLVWIAAEQNVAAIGRWHDIAGYAIVAVVFVASLAIAAVLGKGESAKVEMPPSAAAATAAPPTSVFRPFLLCLLWLVAIEIGVEWWYRSHERVAVPQQQWTVAWPESAPGFRSLPIEESVRLTLRFDEGREASWTASPMRCLLYFFRWNPGGSSVVRARAHRPDICLPSAGWRQLDDGSSRTFEANGMPLVFRRVSFAHQSGTAVAHTFFCLHEDRVAREARPDLELPPGVQPDWSFPARWRAVRNGVRNMGQQVLEFILLAPREVTASDAESKFAAMLPTLVRRN